MSSTPSTTSSTILSSLGTSSTSSTTSTLLESGIFDFQHDPNVYQIFTLLTRQFMTKSEDINVLIALTSRLTYQKSETLFAISDALNRSQTDSFHFKDESSRIFFAANLMRLFPNLLSSGLNDPSSTKRRVHVANLHSVIELSVKLSKFPFIYQLMKQDKNSIWNQLRLKAKDLDKNIRKKVVDIMAIIASCPIIDGDFMDEAVDTLALILSTERNLDVRSHVMTSVSRVIIESKDLDHFRNRNLLLALAGRVADKDTWISRYAISSIGLLYSFLIRRFLLNDQFLKIEFMMMASHPLILAFHKKDITIEENSVIEEVALTNILDGLCDNGKVKVKKIIFFFLNSPKIGVSMMTRLLHRMKSIREKLLAEVIAGESSKVLRDQVIKNLLEDPQLSQDIRHLLSCPPDASFEEIIRVTNLFIQDDDPQMKGYKFRLLTSCGLLLNDHNIHQELVNGIHEVLSTTIKADVHVRMSSLVILWSKLFPELFASEDYLKKLAELEDVTYLVEFVEKYSNDEILSANLNRIVKVPDPDDLDITKTMDDLLESLDKNNNNLFIQT